MLQRAYIAARSFSVPSILSGVLVELSVEAVPNIIDTVFLK
jgi:hypothetical protein